MYIHNIYIYHIYIYITPPPHHSGWRGTILWLTHDHGPWPLWTPIMTPCRHRAPSIQLQQLQLDSRQNFMHSLGDEIPKRSGPTMCPAARWRWSFLNCYQIPCEQWTAEFKQEILPWYHGIASLWGSLGCCSEKGAPIIMWLPDICKLDVSQVAVSISLVGQRNLPLNAGCAASTPRNEFPTQNPKKIKITSIAAIRKSL